MSIELFQRLAFRLSRISVLIAFLLGFALSLWQIVNDFSAQLSLRDEKIIEIVEVARDSAQQTVHQLDSDYAQKLMLGLEAYRFLSAAILIDDRDEVLASFEKPLFESVTSYLTSKITSTSTEYKFNLENEQSYVEGQLVFVVDNNQFLQSFYQRSSNVVLSAIARNLLLALLLLGAFYIFVTRPLVSIATSVGDIDSKAPEGRRIEIPQKNEKNEIGFIVEAINGFLDSAEQHQDESNHIKDQLNVIINTVPNLIFATTRTGDFLFANSQAMQHFDKDGLDLIGKNFFELSRSIATSITERERLVQDCQQVIDTGVAHENKEVQTKSVAGEEKHFQVSRVPFTYYGEPNLLHIAVDITARVAAESQVRTMAYFDSLTGLPNRNLLIDRLEMDISRTVRHRNYGALLFIDLDNFKLVNDTAGHAAGDELLVQIATTINKVKRTTDTLARLGGDEFALTTPDLAENKDEAVSNAMLIAEKILTKLNLKFRTAGQEYNTTASIGVVIYDRNFVHHDELFRYADTAMYNAKREGKNKASLFDVAMLDDVQKQLDVKNDLQRALDEGEFEIYLQPIVSNSGENISGAEVLIRWNHPERGLVLPAAFITDLEKLELIAEVTKICFRQSCQLAIEIGAEKLLSAQFRFSINISAQEFYIDGFENELFAILSEYGLSPRLFELEVTESITLQDIQVAENKMSELRGMGFSFALDDFGTGYSSLSYLKRLPLDKLKIDRSFIHDIQFDPKDRSLIESIIDIARNFNLIIVAEGIETQEQMQWLNQFSGMRMQGYYFAMPMPVNTFLEFSTTKTIGISERNKHQ